MKHRIKPQYLITIAPAIDGFVLDCAIEQGIDTKQFGIPSDLKGFTQMSKSVTSNTDPRFKALFASIKGNAEIKALKMTLKYMYEEQYRVANEVLKAMIEEM